MKFKWLWHEPSNSMALADLSCGDFPLLTVFSDDYKGLNPFLSYSLNYLSHYGWIEIGEI